MECERKSFCGRKVYLLFTYMPSFMGVIRNIRTFFTLVRLDFYIAEKLRKRVKVLSFHFVVVWGGGRKKCVELMLLELRLAEFWDVPLPPPTRESPRRVAFVSVKLGNIVSLRSRSVVPNSGSLWLGGTPQRYHAAFNEALVCSLPLLVSQTTFKLLLWCQDGSLPAYCVGIVKISMETVMNQGCVSIALHPRISKESSRPSPQPLPAGALGYVTVQLSSVVFSLPVEDTQNGDPLCIRPRPTDTDQMLLVPVVAVSDVLLRLVHTLSWQRPIKTLWLVALVWLAWTFDLSAWSCLAALLVLLLQALFSEPITQRAFRLSLAANPARPVSEGVEAKLPYHVQLYSPHCESFNCLARIVAWHRHGHTPEALEELRRFISFGQSTFSTLRAVLLAAMLLEMLFGADVLVGFVCWMAFVWLPFHIAGGSIVEGRPPSNGNAKTAYDVACCRTSPSPGPCASSATVTCEIKRVESAALR